LILIPNEMWYFFSNCSYLENISRKILCCKLRVCGNTGCQKKKQYNVSLIAVQSNEEEEIICLLTCFYFSIIIIIINIIMIILFYILLLLLSLFFFWGVLPVDFIYFKDCFYLKFCSRGSSLSWAFFIVY
jgi:hypothetical protein